MLTTLLIAVPLAAALVVWVLPLSRESTGGLALMAVLAEVGLWVGGARNFDFSSDAQQFSTSREWFSELGISYAVGLYGFQYWLVGLTVVVCAAAVGYGLWVGRDRRPSLRDVEQEYIRYVLEQVSGSQTRAAAILGISRKALWEKRRRFGIP